MSAPTRVARHKNMVWVPGGTFAMGSNDHYPEESPVREVTVASTLQRLLLDITAVGADVEWLPSGSGVPSLVIGEVALSGS